MAFRVESWTHFSLTLTKSLNRLEAESVKEFIWLGWGRWTLFRGPFTVRCHVLFLSSLGQRSQRAMAWSHTLAGWLDSAWLRCEGRSSKSTVTINAAKSWEFFILFYFFLLYLIFILTAFLQFPSCLQIRTGVFLVPVALKTHTHCFNVLRPLLYLFGLARFPSFCHASFSLCFTAGPHGRGACLLTLSPEGSGISESKYVPMSTIREGTMACLLACAGVRWGFGPACCDHTSAPFTTVTLLSHVYTQGGDRRFDGAYYCISLLSRVKQQQTV